MSKKYKQIVAEIQKDENNPFSIHYIAGKNWLPWSTHIHTLQRIIERKKLKAYIEEPEKGVSKSGRRYYIAKKDLLDYLKEHKHLLE